AAVLQLGLDLGVHGTGRDQRGCALVVDHLGVNVLGAPEDGQAGTFCGPKQPLADAMLPAPAAGLDQQVMVGGVHGTILNSQEKRACESGRLIRAQTGCRVQRDYLEPKALPALRRTASPS